MKKLIFFILLFVAAKAQAQTAEEWKLVTTQDGVEFYLSYKTSKVNGQTNTIIKVQNTNAYQVQVTFAPGFACVEGDTFNVQPAEDAFIEPNAASLHTYKICPTGTPQVRVNNVVVKKRE